MKTWNRAWLGKLALALGLTVIPTLLLGCQVQPAANQEANAALTPASTPTPQPKPTPLTGELTADTLKTHDGWAETMAEAYTPDAAALEVIRGQAQEFQVLVFLGTWCPDSVREVPRLLQIAQQAGIPEERLTLIGLDYTKVDAEGQTEQWGVEYVPTIILLDEQGQELGRIVERPSETDTLEGDISAILTRAAAS
ncbi:MAG: hypothetical protein GX552_11190 [Chloroflexi bacterium]|jgi:thiol-disulfide isomerase/thioredoxin|nr:hypothetical protein [Chloroflexota bacterium]